jgi:SAM-dependent methyltransferase
MNRPRLPRATDLAHAWVRERLQNGPGSGLAAVDATAGNGHDTLFLARLVGPQGRVFAYDVQAEAIETTRRRLEAAGLLERVRLRLASHEELGENGPVDVVMFNLGYCPGGDKKLITQVGSTLRALEAAVDGLNPGGLVTVVCYPAHPGGREEADAVLEWARQLDPRQFRAMRCETLLVQGEPAPFLVGIERWGG